MKGLENMHQKGSESLFVVDAYLINNLLSPARTLQKGAGD
jgi:hypothetical protein